MEDVLPFLNALRLLSAFDRCPSDSSPLGDQEDVHSLLLDLLDNEQPALSQTGRSKRTHSTASTPGSDEGDDGERDVGTSILQTSNSGLEGHFSQDSNPGSTICRFDGVSQLKVYGRISGKPLRKKDNEETPSRGSTSPIRSPPNSLPSSLLSRASSDSSARSPLIEHLSPPARDSSPIKSSWRLKRKFSHAS